MYLHNEITVSTTTNGNNDLTTIRITCEGELLAMVEVRQYDENPGDVSTEFITPRGKTIAELDNHVPVKVYL
jgi:hypothetical protein